MIAIFFLAMAASLKLGSIDHAENNRTQYTTFTAVHIRTSRRARPSVGDLGLHPPVVKPPHSSVPTESVDEVLWYMLEKTTIIAFVNTGRRPAHLKSRYNRGSDRDMRSRPLKPPLPVRETDPGVREIGRCEVGASNESDVELLDAYSRADITVVDSVGPAVVGISGVDESPRGVDAVGAGSGVIIAPDGYILTNHHVVERGNRLRVTLTDGASMGAA